MLPCIQGKHDAGKKDSLAQDSKGNKVGGCSDQACKRVIGDPARSTAPKSRPALVDAPPTKGDAVDISNSSGITIPVQEGTPSTACSMATWMQNFD